jgi:hypothetical protein
VPNTLLWELEKTPGAQQSPPKPGSKAQLRSVLGKDTQLAVFIGAWSPSNYYRITDMAELARRQGAITVGIPTDMLRFARPWHEMSLRAIPPVWESADLILSFQPSRTLRSNPLFDKWLAEFVRLTRSAVVDMVALTASAAPHTDPQDILRRYAAIWHTKAVIFTGKKDVYLP